MFKFDLDEFASFKLALKQKAERVEDLSANEVNGITGDLCKSETPLKIKDVDEFLEVEVQLLMVDFSKGIERFWIGKGQEIFK